MTPGAAILEVACGTGQVGRRLARAGWRVTGLDHSRGMLDFLHRAAAETGTAIEGLEEGDVDAVLTGGVDANMSAGSFIKFCKIGALSASGTRPYGEGADGFVMGEGAGVVMLEELEHAKKRGAEIYAELAGYGVSADAHHLSAPSPDGTGPARAMQMAMKHAGVNPDEIDYLNAHGTSTPLGDIAETRAIKVACGEHAKNGLAVSSTKSMTGHLLGAAGAVEVEQVSDESDWDFTDLALVRVTDE